MKTIQISFLLALAAFCFSSCGNSGANLEREVGEEAAEIVEAITPEASKAGSPGEVPAMTSAEETIATATAAGGLLKLTPSSAVASADLWIASLKGNSAVDDNDLLVENLEKLKTLLQQPAIDGKAVAEVLENLARETKQAANDHDNIIVAQLADLLEQAADALD